MQIPNLFTPSAVISNQPQAVGDNNYMNETKKAVKCDTANALLSSVLAFICYYCCQTHKHIYGLRPICSV